MGMKLFKTAGGYRGKEMKMRCVYVYMRTYYSTHPVRVCGLAREREKNAQGKIGEGNVEREKEGI